ncbi:MAG: hypothetical protein U0Y10_18015 [Spirosomataceae bacterium]
MFQLGLKISLLVGLVLGTCIGVPQLSQKRLEQTYLAAIGDKHARLDSLPSPRILLVGGSSMAFGTDSRMLSDSLHVPVQNLANQIVLGSKFMLNEAKSCLRKGDVVVVGFEYHINSKGSLDQQLLAADNYKPALQYIQFADWKEELTARLQHQIGTVKLTLGALLAGNHDIEPRIQDTVSVFFRKGFSKEGDLLSHLNNPPQLPLQHAELPNVMDEHAILEDIEQFCGVAKQKGVQVFYVFPPYTASAFGQNQGTIQQIEHDFQTSPIRQLGKPQDYVYPDTLFFDSVYHLNAEGRKRRTLQLIRQLKPIFQ